MSRVSPFRCLAPNEPSARGNNDFACHRLSSVIRVGADGVCVIPTDRLTGRLRTITDLFSLRFECFVVYLALYTENLFQKYANTTPL